MEALRRPIYVFPVCLLSHRAFSRRSDTTGNTKCHAAKRLRCVVATFQADDEGSIPFTRSKQFQVVKKESMGQSA